MTPRRVVVKLGGELLADAQRLDAMAAEVAAVERAGHEVLVVHGGGPQAIALQKTLGLEPRIVAGRRITDEATLDVAKMVFAGKLNTELVAALVAQGVRAVGLSGVDAGLVSARRRPPLPMLLDGRSVDVDFGFVGDVDAVDPALALLLLGKGHVPVVCSLATQRDGAVLNVNADTMAAELAVAVGADELVMLTNVPGVFRDAAAKATIFSALTVEQARARIDDGTAGGGMTPKLAACIAAVERGVSRSWIVDGTMPRAWSAVLTRGEAAGTQVIPAREPRRRPKRLAG